jgi:hypothetical protein
MFDATFCINLDRRPDRWAEFLRDLPQAWPWPPPERLAAHDGAGGSPPWWPAGPAAWGCYQSHMNVLRQAAGRRCRAVLVLEDDVMFCENFLNLARCWLSQVPEDWQVLYLGGEHTLGPVPLLTEMPDGCPSVLEPSGVRRTHAYVVRGTTLPYLSSYLAQNTWDEVDVVLNDFIQAGGVSSYCPGPWLVGQRGGVSDLTGRRENDRWWNEVVT